MIKAFVKVWLKVTKNVTVVEPFVKILFKVTENVTVVGAFWTYSL